MHKLPYDMPLQKSFNNNLIKKQQQHKDHSQFQQQFISPINTQTQVQRLFRQQSAIAKNYPNNNNSNNDNNSSTIAKHPNKSATINKYDLPCQRNLVQFLRTSRKLQNRPLSIKSLYQDISRSHIKSKGGGADALWQHDKNISTENNRNSQNMRARVSSIYERLLQESKVKKNGQACSAIATQATFKPRQLKKQIQSSMISQSRQNLSIKNKQQNNNNSQTQLKHHKNSSSQLPNNIKIPTTNQKNPHIHAHTNSHSNLNNLNNTKNSKKSLDNNNHHNHHLSKKLDFNSGAKTKYEKILEEHFQCLHMQSMKKGQFLTAEEIRLSKICGKNSAILKLKERLEPQFSTDASKKDRVQPKSLYKKSQSVHLLSKQSNTQPKYQKIPTKQHHHQKRPSTSKPTQDMLHPPSNSSSSYNNNNHQQKPSYLKKCQSQKWMQMNFHERQQRVLSNRKQKQVQGKQKNIQKQISPCTFKPQLMAKNKSMKILLPQKQSYLQNYYQRLYKKY